MLKGDNMLNILIADDNIYYAKMLMDQIYSTNDNVRVCNITIDGEETLKILSENSNIDIFLLDLKMPKYTGIEILKKLNNKTNYEKSCIAISGEKDLLAKVLDNKLVYAYIFKGFDMEKIMENINDLITYKNNIKTELLIEENLKKELEFLRFNNIYIGTKYLKEAILYILEKKNGDFDNLKRDVFSKIALEYNKSVHNIKCNINTSITEMYYDCESDKIEKYFNISKERKPTTKLVISTIVNKIEKSIKIGKAS